MIVNRQIRFFQPHANHEREYRLFKPANFFIWQPEIVCDPSEGPALRHINNNSGGKSIKPKKFGKKLKYCEET